MKRVAPDQSTNYFDFFFSFVLITNLIFIGAQVNYQAENGHASTMAYDMLGWLYAVLFLAEVLIRIRTSSAMTFFQGPDWKWNLLDFAIVCVSFLDVLSRAIGWDEMNLVRMTRLLRLVRVFRVVRAVRFCRSLRIVIVSIISTLHDGMWAVLLLGMLIYAFGILFTQVVADTENLPAESAAIVYFGTVPRAMATLYMSILGGIDWEIAVIGLSDVSPFLVVVFLVYVAVTLLAILNVVTALFCQRAIESSTNNKQDMIEKHITKMDTYVEALENLFREWDTDGDGALTLQEIEGRLEDPKMKAFLSILEIDCYDAKTLCQLLDSDGEGEIGVNEFVENCMRLRGNAKSIDVAQVHEEISAVRQELLRLTADRNWTRHANEGVASPEG